MQPKLTFSRPGSLHGLVVLSITLLLGSCTTSNVAVPDPTRIAEPKATPTPVQSSATQVKGEVAVLVGAGDIADCDSDGDEKTARLLDDIDGTVFTVGDNVYEDGKASEFKECYEPTWGRHKERTKPAAGNHDYNSEDARPYFDYFGEAAGEPGKGYYSYELGSWHIVVVNSNCNYIGGCDKGSPQERWLRADLAEHPAQCTLAYWHHPVFTAGRYHGADPVMRTIFETLYEAGADVVLTGHDHNYQRFAPQDPEGVGDQLRGIRQFVVGTGGRRHYNIEEPIVNSEVYNDSAYGVLKLTLREGGYDWEFIPVEGESFKDSGSGRCH